MEKMFYSFADLSVCIETPRCLEISGESTPFLKPEKAEWDDQITLTPVDSLPPMEAHGIWHLSLPGESSDECPELPAEGEGIRCRAGKCSKCQMRDQCKACAAMALTETGRFDQVPEYRCQMAQAFEKAGKLLEHQILERRRK